MKRELTLHWLKPKNKIQVKEEKKKKKMQKNLGRKTNPRKLPWRDRRNKWRKKGKIMGGRGCRGFLSKKEDPPGECDGNGNQNQRVAEWGGEVGRRKEVTRTGPLSKPRHVWKVRLGKGLCLFVVCFFIFILLLSKKMFCLLRTIIYQCVS